MLSVEQIRSGADYQQFALSEGGGIAVVGDRMQKKLTAIGGAFPDDLSGRSVLDIGCDFGFWSFLAAERGAKSVLGLDRSRDVKGLGWVDIPRLNNETEKSMGRDTCRFITYEAGTQFHDLGRFDLVLCMSLYHHIYHNTGGDHASIWYWLWRQTKGQLIWENPISPDDPVVRANVYDGFHPGYDKKSILDAASRYFDVRYVGPALHESTREVWACSPKNIGATYYRGKHKDGAGGASKAFVWANNRRIKEISNALGIEPLPGSLNLHLEKDFDWGKGYFRVLIRDLVDRSTGLRGTWRLRPCRFYPILVNEVAGYAMRFEGEKYPLSFVEVISDHVLKDVVAGTIEVCHGNNYLF